MAIQVLAMVRKDMQMFFSDRRAVIMSFVVPIAIASFFGSIFKGSGRNTEPAPDRTRSLSKPRKALPTSRFTMPTRSRSST